MSDYSRIYDAILRGEPISLANPTGGGLLEREPNRILAGLEGAARGLAGFLEPIQLPQDVLFATVAGAIDPDTTIGDRLRRVDLAAYAPWGRSPARPATGREIFELAGLNPTAAKWAGIGADLFADPLLFGSFLRVGGKLLKADDLINWGDKFDDMISPMGISRGVKAGIGRASPELSDLIDRRMEQLVQVVRDPESTFMGVHNFGARFQNVFDKIAPRDKQLQLKFGKEVGAEVAQVERMAKVAGLRVGEEGLNLLAQAQSGMLGQQGEQFVKGFVDILGRYRTAHERHFGSELPQILRDVTERQVYNVADNAGLLYSQVDETSPKGIQDLFNEITEVSFGKAGAKRLDEMPDPIRELVLTGRANVRRVATEAGVDADLAVQRFNDYLQEITEIDALLGKHMSGFDFVKSVAYERVQSLTGSMAEANDFWRGILAAGLNGRFERHLKSETKWSPAQVIRTTPERIEAVRVRREAYKQQLLTELELMRRGDDLDPELVDRMMDELETGVRDLYRRSGEMRQQFLKGDARAEAWQQYESALDAYGAAVVDARKVADEMRALLSTPEGRAAAQRRIGAQPGRDAGGRFAPGVSGNRTPLTTWEILQNKLRQNIAVRMEAASNVERMMDDLINMVDAGTGGRRLLDDELLRALQNMDELKREFNQQRFRVHVSPEAAARAREKAAALAANTPLPALERNLSVEELIVERMAKGKSFKGAMEDPFTVEEIIDSAHSFTRLGLGSYLNGLANGHLRRAYGLFQDRHGFQRYIDALRDGRLLMNNVIEETNLDEAMAGFEREAELIRQYQRRVGGDESPRAVFSQEALVRHLLDNGVEAPRAKEAITALIKGLNMENPAVVRQIETLREMVPDYNLRSGKYFDPRDEVPGHILETLGEFARASASVSESAEIARRVMPVQQLFQNTWKLGKARGLIRNEKFIDDLGTRYIRVGETEGMFKPFSGKYVHPQLLQELERARKHTDTYNGWQRIRALLTGGYLASPNVLAANFFGGFYQAFTAGLGPHRMIPRVAKVWERVRRVQDGHVDEVIERLRAHVPLEISNLPYHDLQKVFERIRLEDIGLGATGLRKTLEDIERGYINFLNRPGVGKLRTRYAGLDGFQMIENVFKVAAFEEMLEELPKRWARKGVEFTDEMVEKHAAEFARTVVFDYTDLPKSLDMFKNTGLILFPGFAYFLAGRTLAAYWRRPGTLGLSDRMSEAIANVQLSEEERLALWVGMPDWLKTAQGTPLTVRTGEPGDKRVSVIPLAQLIPTQTIWDAPLGQGNPWAESITNLGLWGPWLEVMTALVRDEGEAVLSARFGNRVFDEDAQGLTKLAQVGRFLYNTHAPGLARKLIRPSFNEGAEGVIPEMVSYFLPKEMAESVYSFEELRRQRPERAFKDEVLGAMLRSPQVIAISGQLPGIATEIRNARREHQAEISSLRTKYARAQADGNEARMAMLEREIIERNERFNELWQAYVAAYQAAQPPQRAAAR